MNDERRSELGAMWQAKLARDPRFMSRANYRLPTAPSRMGSTRRAFSLMEVILALAVMAGAMTVLGQLIQIGSHNAAAARDLSQAEILCASKMDEIRSGLSDVTTVTNATSETDPDWVYSVESTQTDEQGLLSLRVTFTQNLPAEQHPVAFSLTSWIPDPGAETPDTSDSNSSSSGSSSSSSQ